MSSHREAPGISKDPVADSTDVYAFVSPDRSNTVTLVANYIPLQEPAGGPNFYEFGTGVLYEINIDNTGDGWPDITYQFRFHTKLTTPNSFLYNTGPIKSLSDPTWNSKQFYSVTRVDRHGSTVLGRNLPCPPCNVGILSTPNYERNLGSQAIHSLPGRVQVFAGQRAEQFYVDLGSIFDLANLRPFQEANIFGKMAGLKAAPGVNATNRLNVHTIAIQVPTSQLVRRGKPTIGVWTTASRQKVHINSEDGSDGWPAGPFAQVSRLGNPLINEVLIPLGQKDYWNTQPPNFDKQFAGRVLHPELAGLLPALYPGVFPNLAKLVAAKTPRADLEAILMTGIPAGIVPGFQNFTGPVVADMLRLNTAIPASKNPNILGVAGGDLAGFPNGRRVFDDVVTVELRAIAGLLLPLVDKSFKPDGAASLVTDGLTDASVPSGYLSGFPYLGVPYGGFSTPS